jgi:hypothetical protein
MLFDQVLPLFGVLITLLLGVLGLFFPAKAMAFTSLQAADVVGKSEVRATYGGFFLGLAVVAFIVRTQLVFMTLGCAWLGAALGRLLSLLLDRSVSAKTIAGIGFEGCIGLLLLAPLLR